jgi:glucosamine--fructose-6-phosphate aminotransferase (isomerizing)
MCGIIAYKGKREDAAEIVLKGLKKLEYRGYDSWGVAALRLRSPRLSSGQAWQAKQAGDFFIYKKTGKIGELKISDLELPKSNLAMAHSRWATHGGVTEKNAHPHASCNNKVVT